MPGNTAYKTVESRASVFFFFQAEDGIRDFHVTGVQTCALPISRRRPRRGRRPPSGTSRAAGRTPPPAGRARFGTGRSKPSSSACAYPFPDRIRSEERRVGKERSSRRSPGHQKRERKKREGE